MGLEHINQTIEDITKSEAYLEPCQISMMLIVLYDGDGVKSVMLLFCKISKKSFIIDTRFQIRCWYCAFEVSQGLLAPVSSKNKITP